MNKKTLTRTIPLILTTAALAMTLAGCDEDLRGKRLQTKDLPIEGYDYSFFQRASGTEHNRKIEFFVDGTDIADTIPNVWGNILEGMYINTGTEAPEFIQDFLGNKLLVQGEKRLYYDWWENRRFDITGNTLYNPSTGQLSLGEMVRVKTEWWGSSDDRIIRVNRGPTMFRFEGVSEYFGVRPQGVFAVLLPKTETNTDRFFNSELAGDTREFLMDIERELEQTDFHPSNYDVLISTRDRDQFFDWAGVETLPAVCQLFNGAIEYTIGARYMGPNNKLFVGGGFKGLGGHIGAPDRRNKLGETLDTVFISRTSDYGDYPEVVAQMEVYHPNFANQAVYEFFRINDHGEKELMGKLRRTYNDLSTTATDDDGNTVVTSLAASNDYMLDGDLDFIRDFFVLMGGQLKQLGFDYKTAFTEYACDLLAIAQAIQEEAPFNPEHVVSLNVNADATIENVCRAAENIFGATIPENFQAYRAAQANANQAFEAAARRDPALQRRYNTDF